jgi:hypothetical protein
VIAPDSDALSSASSHFVRRVFDGAWQVVGGGLPAYAAAGHVDSCTMFAEHGSDGTSRAAACPGYYSHSALKIADDIFRLCLFRAHGDSSARLIVSRGGRDIRKELLA